MLQFSLISKKICDKQICMVYHWRFFYSTSAPFCCIKIHAEMAEKSQEKKIVFIIICAYYVHIWEVFLLYYIIGK